MTDRANAICLLQVLKDYSDANHILPMRELTSKLAALYDISVDRRTVYSAVELLIHLGYDISDYKDNGIGYYLRTRVLELSEVRMLMDAVYSFPYLPPKQTEYLIEKLQGLLSVHERKQYRHLTAVGRERKTTNEEVFLNIELLDEAIAKHKKVAFLYLEYGFDKELHPRKASKYVVSPYGMVCENERYYLINIKDGFQTPSLYRIDLMRELEIMDAPISISSKNAHLDSVRRVTYAYVGEQERIKLRCDHIALDHVLDHFGTNIKIQEQDGGSFIAEFMASPNGVRYWALQYLQYVEVLAPQHLRKEVIAILRKNKYQEEVESW